MDGNKILVVDDDSDITWFFRQILEGEGFSVSTAQKGAEALELARKEKFDLAILDVVLPDIQGDKLAKELSKKNKSLKIIFVTGFTQKLEGLDSTGLNIVLVMEKPVMYEQLKEAVKKALTEG
jgi:two-component system cell cycle sensor histidine kinase/response regulator CckA